MSDTVFGIALACVVAVSGYLGMRLGIWIAEQFDEQLADVDEETEEDKPAYCMRCGMPHEGKCLRGERKY